MRLWSSDNWEAYFKTPDRRTGLCLRFEKGIDAEIRDACRLFCKWLKIRYMFPIRVPIYFKNAEYITTNSGERCSAKFFSPHDRLYEPFITIATRDLDAIAQRKGKAAAILTMYSSIAHELSHYFQWIKILPLTEKQEERQAKYYQHRVVQQYLDENWSTLGETLWDYLSQFD